MTFNVHTIESAPQGEQLEASQTAFGFIPNLHGVLAESPAALNAYKTLGDLFGKTSLSLVERNVVWMTSNEENNCHYCKPAHTAIAHMSKVPADVIQAIRTGTDIADPKLQALRVFTQKVVNQRGQLSDADTRAFLNAGYESEDILGVIVGVAHKVISNYTNHFADTPIDERFQSFV